MALPPVTPGGDMVFISKRPVNPRLFRDENTTPDVVIELRTEFVVRYYSCWRKRIKNDENCWKIRLTIENINTGVGVLLDDSFGNYSQGVIEGANTTQTLYPYGCDGYNFNPNHIMVYDWQYRY